VSLPEHAAGSTWCECSECGAGFGGVTLFDKHRVGEIGARRCLTPDEMVAKNWHQDGKGLWRSEASATMPGAADTEGANRPRTAKRVHGDSRRAEAAAS
jgi:hypothetical protein